MTGLMVCLRPRYKVLSNRESGSGRYDLALIPCLDQLPGILFEFKKAKRDNLEASAQAALDQMKHRNYSQVLGENRPS